MSKKDPVQLVADEVLGKRDILEEETSSEKEKPTSYKSKVNKYLSKK